MALMSEAGSNFHYGLGASLLFLIPRIPFLPASPFSDMRGLIFSNLGSNTVPWINAPSYSVGAGLVYPTRYGTIEGGIAVPLSSHPRDLHRDSPWYLRIGFEFM
jgi:hypothetical protein